MSPQLISSLRSRLSPIRTPSPQPANADATSTSDGSSSFAIGQVETIQYAAVDGANHIDQENRPPELDSAFGFSDYDAPPSTQPRPEPWDMIPYVESNNFPILRIYEPPLEHYICFIYRENAIWFRVRIVIEELGLVGRPHPRVEVQHVENPAFRDASVANIGIVVERELQEGLRRAVESALRR